MTRHGVGCVCIFLLNRSTIDRQDEILLTRSIPCGCHQITKCIAASRMKLHKHSDIKSESSLRRHPVPGRVDTNAQSTTTKRKHYGRDRMLSLKDVMKLFVCVVVVPRTV